MFIEVIECLKCKRPSSTNQMIRVQSMRIEIKGSICSTSQVREVLAVFGSTCFY